MAGSPRGKRPFNLALLAGFAESLVSESSTTRSTRCFDGGAVGLRIVAAMTEVAGPRGAFPCWRPATAGARSDPIPIVPAGVLPERRVALDEDGEEEDEDEDEEEELSESYTCVIRHEGGSIVRRMVYLTGEGFDGADDIFGENQEAFFYCSLPPPRATVDPRSRCRGCAQRKLHDFVVYGMDCRCLWSDEQKDVCFDFSKPPISKHLLNMPCIAAT